MSTGIKVNAGEATANPVKPGDRFASVYPRLRRFAASYGDAWMEPDDLVQEALSRVLHAHPDLNDLRDPETFLLKAIANLVRNERRAEGRARRALSRITPEDEHDQVYPFEAEYLLAVNPSVRAALVMVDLEGYSFEEAAKVIGISTVALRARVSRARRAIKKHLEDGD